MQETVKPDKVTLLLSKFDALVQDDLKSELQHFARSMEFSKSQNTILSYLYDLKLGLEYFALQTQATIDLGFVQGMTLIQFRSLCNKCRVENKSVTSQQRMVVTWKVFMRFLDLSTLNNFRMQKKPIRHPKAMTEDDAYKVVSLPENPTWLDYRNRALWGVMYGSGLRISEALSLKVGQISDYIRILGKGKKLRIVPILPSVIEYIQEYLGHRRFDNEYLFVGAKGEVLTQQSASHVFRVWRDKHNLPKNLTLHSLRHSFATHLLRNNCPLNAVQKLLGHSSLTRTMQYLSISSEQLTRSYNRHMGDASS